MTLPPRRSVLQVVFVWIVVLVPASSAQEARYRRTWELTLDERVARRLDPSDIRRRAENAARPRPGVTTAQSPGGAEPAFVIDGSKDPELFLPWELFDHLVRTPDDPAAAVRHRQRFNDRIARYGWTPDEFWTEVEALDASYASLRRESVRLQEESAGAGSELAPLAHELCAARAGALERARERFGSRLDEFLYTEIAPTMSLRSARVPDASMLRWISGGCK